MGVTIAIDCMGGDHGPVVTVPAALEFLRSPPGNRLEALAGDRKGQYSIRINDQWRVCFVWTDSGPAMVEIVDYH